DWSSDVCSSDLANCLEKSAFEREIVPLHLRESPPPGEHYRYLSDSRRQSWPMKSLDPRLDRLEFGLKRSQKAVQKAEKTTISSSHSLKNGYRTHKATKLTASVISYPKTASLKRKKRRIFVSFL